MIIGVMHIERVRVAFVAVVDDIRVSIREQLPSPGALTRGSCDIAARCATPRCVPEMRLKAVTVSEPKVPGPNILFVRLTRRYIPIVRVTGVR
jgi:hypothetical protein